MKAGDVAKTTDTLKVGIVVDIGPVWTKFNTNNGQCYVRTRKLVVVLPITKN